MTLSAERRTEGGNQMFSREKRIGRRALTCAAALLGLLGAASPALGSDAWLEPYVVNYEADPGEANQTTITANSNLQLGGGGPFVDDAPAAIDIDDVGANITPHWGFLHHGGCET